MSKPFSDTNLEPVGAFSTLRPFLSRTQMAMLRTMAHPAHSQEWQFYVAKVEALADLVAGMVQTYQQEGKGDQATVYLHYFIGGSDWYITEKDVDGGVEQAFGYAVLNGDEDCAELGYISIQELAACGAELDLYFSPCTLGEIKARRRQADQAEAFSPNAWVLVNNPGQDDEDIVADFPTFAEVVAAQKEAGEGDIMKRLDDGRLTTEF